VLVTVIGFFLMLDSLLLRVVSGSAIFGVQASLVLAVMLQKRRETIGRGQHLIVVSLAMMVTTYVLRGFGAATGMVQMTSVTASNSVQVITFLSTLVCAILISLGFVLMAKERADERNRVLSIQDELTGLANRRCLNEALDSELARAQRSRQAMALLMVDIDLFKKFNDRYGHQAGDDCLRSVARNLRSCAQRAGDLAARYGGEEFVLILPNTDISQARRIAQALCQSIASLRIPHEDSPEGKVTVSIGAAAMSDGGDIDAANLLRAADEALYRAKRGGRNQVQLAVQLPP
jgi:diguanylate cyclase (GGDEF)-like protein